MGPKKANKKTARVEEHPPKPKKIFNGLRIAYIQPRTAAIALKSVEPAVQLQALNSLNCLAERDVPEVGELLGVQDDDEEAAGDGLIARVWSLVEGDSRPVAAYAYRLLVTLYDKYKETVLKMIAPPQDEAPFLAPNYYANAAFNEYAAQTDNVLLQEMASRLLVRLTEYDWICNDLCDNCDVNQCFNRLKSTDPDLQYNTLKIIFNISKAGECVNHVVNLEEFSFTPILNLMWSDYLDVQYLATDLINWFLTLPKSEKTLFEIFRVEGGMGKFMETLNMFEWQDLHERILTALSMMVIAAPSATCDRLYEMGGIKQLVDYMDNIDDDYLIEKALEVIIKLAQNPLTKRGVTVDGMRERVRDLMRTLLLEGTKEMVDMCCHGLGYIWKGGDMVDQAALDKIVAMATNMDESWETRTPALCTVRAVVNNSPTFALYLLDVYQIDSLMCHLHEVPRTIPLNCAEMIILMMLSMVIDKKTRERVLTTDLVESFIRCCQDEEDEMALYGAEAVKTSLEVGRDAEWSKPCRLILEINGHIHLVYRMYSALATKKPLYKTVVSALASILKILLEDTVRRKTVSTSLIRGGVLDWAISNKSFWRECPEMQTIVELIFEQQLPAKLAYTGQLCMQDKMCDGFYLTKERIKKFHLLGDESPEITVYLINFDDVRGIRKAPKKQESLDSYKEFWGGVCCSSSDLSDSDRPSEASGSCLSIEPSTEGPILPDDPYLPQLLDQLRRNLNITVLDTIEWNTDSALDQERVKERIEAISQIVAEQLSRGGSSGDAVEPYCCNTATLDLHVSQLRQKLDSNVIPIGYLRVGRLLERAILFKSLADKTGLLCALKLGDYNTAWVEIALPQVQTKEPRFRLPLKHLKTNYVVDLTIRPGRLIRVGTQEADTYCRATGSVIIKQRCPLFP